MKSVLLCLSLVPALALVSVSHAQLATDNADNAAYDDGWTNTDNGGSGFNAWGTIVNGYLDGAAQVDGTRSFAHFSGGQSNRDLTTPLASGTFTLNVRFNIENDDAFAGFNLQTGATEFFNQDGSELLAIGMTPGTGNTAVDIFGLTAQTMVLSNTDIRGDVLSFSIAFDAAAGTYTVNGTNVSEAFVGTPVVGSLKTGGGTGPTVGSFSFGQFQAGTDQNLIFDSMTVVPEPGTVLLLLSGLGMVMFRRRRS